MTEIIDLREKRAHKMAGKAFRNWRKRFGEEFGMDTRISDISMPTLAFLASGGEDATFYIYDLVMNLLSGASGLQFESLSADEKIRVTERYFFLLDQFRFECMKRIGWIRNCPGENYRIVELIGSFDTVAPGLQACTPMLSESHPRYGEFAELRAIERESFVRGLIPDVLSELESRS